MRSGTLAWAAIAAGIIAYELFAPPGELLSQACDRARARRPIATHAAILYIAAHLARVWPRRLDPLHLIAERASRGAA